MPSDSTAINASPTKEFFISMLTRDIRLHRAILDLIDNSIDGAKKIRSSGDYKGLTVTIATSQEEFSIIDNCGGFSLHTAQEYAFRFGRPTGSSPIENSVGRFGVGMKRALFKMGRKFTIESKNGMDHFIVEVDVDDWLQEPDNWHFNYIDSDNFRESEKKLSSDGTAITVTKLHDNVKNDFVDTSFLNELEREIAIAISYSILKNLRIELNEITVGRKDIDLLQSKSLKPSLRLKKIKDVSVQIYTGIGKPEPHRAGWYIFCNDRLVLEADKSFITGWRESREDEANNVIKYHNTYAMFRGVVFFEARDPNNLPMTTTKTGIDSDHPVYKTIRPEMLTAMRQVITFLKKIPDQEERDNIVANSDRVDITDIRNHKEIYKEEFLFPVIDGRNDSYTDVAISYSRDRALVEKIKDFLNTSTNKNVGERTFDYFVDMHREEIGYE